MGVLQVELGPARKAAEGLDTSKASTPSSGAPSRRRAFKCAGRGCRVHKTSSTQNVHAMLAVNSLRLLLVLGSAQDREGIQALHDGAGKA